MSKKQSVTINETEARRISSIFKSLRFSHPDNLAPLKISPESNLFLIYILVGICHQFNWNVLISSLDKVRTVTPSKFTPKYLAKISHQELTGWLSDYPKKERLAKKFKRAKLVRNMAKVLLKNHDGKITHLLRQAKGKIGGAKGTYALLRETIAYGEDPLFKKASVFVDVVDDLRLANFTDWDQYVPPIDYHIARILIRTGVIKIRNKSLEKKLLRYSLVNQQQDLLIRGAAIEAIKLMAGKTPKKRKIIQGLLWCIGRDCCHEEKAHCQACKVKNCSCKNYIDVACNGKCFLKDTCYAYKENKSYLQLREQNFISTWY